MAEPMMLRADCQGTMTIGDLTVDCYVLKGEKRVITSNGVLELLSGARSGNLARYISRIPNNHKLLDAVPMRFSSHTGPAYGYEADVIWAILEAYDEAWEQGLLRQEQIPIARRARALMRAWGKVGLVAVIDEVTGYQRIREVDALQVKTNAYIRDELRIHEPTFPDKVWREMFRLDMKPYHPSRRPQHFGRKILDYVYDAMDKDVAEELKHRIANPHYGNNLHQLLTDFGLRKLHTQLEVFYRFLESSTSWDDFESRWAMTGPHGQFGLDLDNEPDPIPV